MFGDAKPKSTNVVDRWLKWKGADDDGYFAYYDKEKGEDVKYDFNEGIIIREQYQVQGFDATTNSRIQCNKVTSTKDEPFRITLGGAVIYDDLYNKEIIEKMGHKLHLCLTVMTNDEIVELSIKGTGFGKYIELGLDGEKFKLKQTAPEGGKAWAIKYKTPIFIEGSEITGEEREAALEVVKTINTAPVEEKEEIEEGDIPF